jgi:hypothetical protein
MPGSLAGAIDTATRSIERFTLELWLYNIRATFGVDQDVANHLREVILRASNREDWKTLPPRIVAEQVYNRAARGDKMPDILRDLEGGECVGK